MSLVKAMRTRFYRWLSDMEDDGGRLQLDYISRRWNFLGHYQIAPAWGIAARSQVYKRRGDKTSDAAQRLFPTSLPELTNQSLDAA